MSDKNLNRCIIHVDMDAFFASVEQLCNPSYRNKPIIVGALPGNRGVVSTASYEARKYGVRSAMPVSTAFKICPEGIFVPVNMPLYKKYSAEVFKIFEEFTPVTEVASIDEAYLDMTGCPALSDGWETAGLMIKKSIKDSLGLTASVGMAVNKFVAKIASDSQKPDGLVIIKEGEELNFLKPMPVGKLFGVGKKTQERLRLTGINTVGQLQEMDISVLRDLFSNFGEYLFFASRGIDDSSVKQKEQVKSVGHEITFEEDTQDKEVVLSNLAELSQKTGTRLRKKRLSGRCITLKLRFADFNTITRRITLNEFTNHDHTIYETAKKIFQTVNCLGKIRLIGVTVSDLSEGNAQGSLFDEKAAKNEQLYESIDRIKDRYGKNVIKLGTVLKKNAKKK